MILTCSSCASRFEIDSAHLGTGGRKVRCGRCGHTWHQAPEPSGAPGDEPDRISTPIPKLQEFDDARRRSAETKSGETGGAEGRRSHVVPWLIFVVVVALIGLGLTFGKERIVQAIPEAGKLYQLAGFEAEPARAGEGLDLRDVTQFRRVDGDQRMLLIEGTIVNISDQQRPVPSLRATISDEAEQVVDSWAFKPEVEILEPGEQATFQTSTKDPPKNGNLTLDFEENQP